MPTMNNSPLFKRLKQATRPEDHASLLDHLDRVRNDWRGHDANGKAPSLAQAFVWERTPQGFAFWYRYAKKLKDEGWPDVAGI